MSDVPPPAYSAVGTGENIPPPGYNEQAPTAPPSYNPSAPVSQPVASQPTVKYVDQYGNPVNPPPTANVKYVDQNGNPVNPPKYDQNGKPIASPIDIGDAKPIGFPPAVKYVDQYGNPVNSPQQAQQPQSNVKYVDQYGNPVAAPKTAPVVQQPAANVKYVDQYGNPVAAPKTAVQQPAANVKYVDQYGNPVAAPKTAQQPAVKYVDQYGNPVAAPKTAPVVQPAANVKYVDQYGNPVNPPPTAGVVVAPGASGTARPVTRSIKQQKTASFFLGGIALLILFIGMCVDSLASGTSYVNYDVTTTCGWTELSVDCGDSYSYYSSSCTDASISYGDYCDLEKQYDIDVSPSWCGTQASASISLVTMLIATIMCGIGVIFVQPWCPITACCCKTNPNCGCARVSFIFSLCFGILTLIIWLAGDEICLGSGNYHMGLGGSMVCDIIGMIFVIIAASLAK